MCFIKINSTSSSPEQGLPAVWGQMGFDATHRSQAAQTGDCHQAAVVRLVLVSYSYITSVCFMWDRCLLKDWPRCYCSNTKSTHKSQCIILLHLDSTFLLDNQILPAGIRNAVISVNLNYILSTTIYNYILNGKGFINQNNYEVTSRYRYILSNTALHCLWCVFVSIWWRVPLQCIYSSLPLNINYIAYEQ